MSEQKHTPEPWESKSTEYKHLILSNTHFLLGTIQYEHDLARIVECVNALAGIENPAEWVRILKEERVESRVSYWKEKAENSDWRYKELQSENEKLKAELETHKNFIKWHFGPGGGKFEGEGGKGGSISGGTIHPNIIDETPIG